jgi:hypothetical protein
MILASELIDLIDVSTKSITEVGGYKGLIEIQLFSNKEKIGGILRFMHDYTIIDMTVDGFFEDLYIKGFTDEQYYAVFDFGLMEYVEQPYTFSGLDLEPDLLKPETIGWFKITDLGESILKEIEEQSI